MDFWHDSNVQIKSDRMARAVFVCKTLFMKVRMALLLPTSFIGFYELKDQILKRASSFVVLKETMHPGVNARELSPHLIRHVVPFPLFRIRHDHGPSALSSLIESLFHIASNVSETHPVPYSRYTLLRSAKLVPPLHSLQYKAFRRIVI